ncbi:hypothetical protein [Streptomyces sp. NPDC059909]|uniref:hypothetical protein n=1 Tax=Streptomyces sp. NPDC059909 TaxID=3346998 RepID=UPI00365C0AC6
MCRAAPEVHSARSAMLGGHFTAGWNVLLTLRTNEFTEQAHVGGLQNHTHRMGLLLAARTAK